MELFNIPVFTWHQKNAVLFDQQWQHSLYSALTNAVLFDQRRRQQEHLQGRQLNLAIERPLDSGFLFHRCLCEGFSVILKLICFLIMLPVGVAGVKCPPIFGVNQRRED
jgi:hypothetical protein